MTHAFPHIGILGGGLLGGSLALALRETNAADITLWSRREETTRAALARGISRATSDLAAAVADRDLLVLCVPVGAMPALLADAISSGLPSGCLVTDVGSVKGTPHQTLGPLCRENDLVFIGSHPMAGSEQGGIDSADSSIFQNAACLLTDDEAAPAGLCAALETFWREIGCRTAWMTSAEHDDCVARISHLPHIIAAAAANVCMKNPALLPFSGGGLRDTTRVAAGNPAMWAEILTENQSAILPALRETISDLTRFLAALETNDQATIKSWLATAKQQRDQLREKR